jgi:TolB-like protein
VSDEILERLKTTLGDRYRIERELGRGGMATVFLAEDIKHGRQVAIKVLHPELSVSIGGDRFEREIRLAAKLQHPHILGLYDSGVADSLLYYVMPFVEGESLRDRIDREGQLPVEDAVQIVLEVADALGHAHAQNIVHRDIKPENILLSNGHALVADFGIARAVEEGGHKLTQTGMAVGTPVYMAPEQAVGESVGPTADIYSLGCVLYEMLAGEPPFTGKNAAAIMARHAMETVPSIRIVRQAVPEEVEEAIFAAMGKVPADRPKTAAHFAEILGVPLGATATRRVAMRHTTARRVPTPSRDYGAVGEGPVPVWRRPVVLALAAVLVLGGGFAAWQLTTGGPTRAPILPGGLDARSIAVLYFDDLSPDRSLGHVADGLTETLIRTLGGVQGLRVVSPGGVEPWRNAGVSVDSIGRALQAGTIVRGSVEPEGGDRLRINLRLLDGNSGADLVERATLTPSAADLLSARDAVAEEVAGLIRRRLGEEIRLGRQRTGTTNVEAWALVQRAEVLRKNGNAAATRGDAETMHRNFLAADSLLAAAEGLDPRWAEPVILRGLVSYQRSRVTGLDPFVAKAPIEEGLAHVERALALDPNNADALELRGNLRYWYVLLQLEPDAVRAQAMIEQARQDFESATRINPAQAGAWASVSHLHYRLGSILDANVAAQRALEADAFLSNADVILSRLFFTSYDLEQFTGAVRWCQEIRRRFPESMPAARCELFLLTTRARDNPSPAQAWALADTVVQRAPAARREFMRLNSDMLVAVVLARTGLADSARAVIHRSLGDPRIDPQRELAQYGAFAYTLLGDAGQAVELLKVWLAANDTQRQTFRDNPSWWFRPLTQDPQFRQLVGG